MTAALVEPGKSVRQGDTTLSTVLIAILTTSGVPEAGAISND